MINIILIFYVMPILIGLALLFGRRDKIRSIYRFTYKFTYSKRNDSPGYKHVYENHFAYVTIIIILLYCIPVYNVYLMYKQLIND